MKEKIALFAEDVVLTRLAQRLAVLIMEEEPSQREKTVEITIPARIDEVLAEVINELQKKANLACSVPAEIGVLLDHARAHLFAEIFMRGIGPALERYLDSERLDNQRAVLNKIATRVKKGRM